MTGFSPAKAMVCVNLDIIGSTYFMETLNEEEFLRFNRAILSFLDDNLPQNDITGGYKSKFTGDGWLIFATMTEDNLHRLWTFSKNTCETWRGEIADRAGIVATAIPEVRLSIGSGNDHSVTLSDGTIDWVGDSARRAVRASLFASAGKIVVDSAVHDALKRRVQFHAIDEDEKRATGKADVASFLCYRAEIRPSPRLDKHADWMKRTLDRAELPPMETTILDVGFGYPKLRLQAGFETRKSRTQHAIESISSIFTPADLGELGLAGQDDRSVHQHALLTFPDKFNNDSNIVLKDGLESLSDQAEAIVTDYAIIQLYRRLQEIRSDADDTRLFFSSANLLLIDASRKSIIVQYRGNQSWRSAGHYHIFGGHIDPFKDSGGDYAACAERECFEEARAHVSVKDCIALLQYEGSSTDTFALTYLGVPVGSHAMRGNVEGGARALAFEEIPTSFEDDLWVPAGAQAIMAWLAVGAPYAAGSALSVDKAHALLQRCKEAWRNRIE